MPPPHKPALFSGAPRWDQLEQVVEQFEDAWQQGRQPDIDEYLRAEDVERESLVIELAHADLECRLKAGESVRVEAYFGRYRELTADDERALGLIAAEFDLRRRREPALSPAEYLRRFPQYANELPARLRASSGGAEQPSLLASCPRCRNPIEPVKGATASQVSCPSCGGSFRMDPAHPLAWSPEKLTRLGKFELLETVGRGAFGTVYRARDAELDRVVAVKVPRGSQWVSRAEVGRFLREARNAARLAHPGIVPVYEAGQSEALPYIVTAFVEGQTLAQALAGRRFGFREAAEVVAQAAEALEHAHHHGVIHRDLKPSNILLGQLHGARLETDEALPPQAFVADFGLAWRDEGDGTVTVEGQILGTPAYMSPEQARGQSNQADSRSDVYSLGVILYELLTGEVPFRGVARMVLRQILDDEPRPPRQLNDKISRDLETIALKCLAKEPGRRYAAAGDLAADLRRHLNGEPIHARPVGRLEKAWRWARRNPRVAALSAAVATLLLVLAAGGTAAAVVFARQRDAEAEARQLAGQQRDLALEALGKQVYEIQSHLKDRPDLHALRENLLTSAIALLERVARDGSFRPDHSTISAHNLLGEIYLTLGRTEDARQQFERSRALAETQVAEAPQNALARRELGVSLGKLGVVSLRTGDAASARALHEQAVELHQALLPIDPKPPLAHRDLMIARNQLGDDLVQLGEVAQARQAYTEGRKLAEALVAAEPKNVDYRYDRAISHEHLGKVCLKLGDAAAALDHHRQALAEREALARQLPGSLFARRQVLVSCRDVGDLSLKKGDLTSAERMYRRAFEVCAEVLKVDPQNVQVRGDLALSAERLGDLQQRRFNFPGARDSYRQALEQQQRLAGADPSNAQTRRNATAAQEKLGVLLRRTGELEAARENLCQVVDQRQALAEAHRENVQAQTELAAALGNLGMTELMAGRFTPAIDHYGRGLAILQQLDAQGKLKGQPLYQGWFRTFRFRLAVSKAAERAVEDLDFALRQPANQVPELLVIRARALAGRGRHAEVAATAEKLRTLTAASAANLYNVGCCYALGVRGVAPGKAADQLTIEEAAARAEYTRRAVEALTEAVQHGYRNGAEMRTDLDLTALHSAAGYQELIEKIAPPPRSEGPG